MDRTYNYFELKRGVVYRCNLDGENFEGKFEYKLHKHYLVYRKVGGEWDYDKGRSSLKWNGVWNSKYYNDTVASYKPVK